MIYAYYRVSTDEQNEANQAFGVERYAEYKQYTIDKVVIEHAVSGKVYYKDRLLWNLMKQAKDGDLILVSELSRLSRSMADMFEIARYLSDKKVNVYCVKENLEIGTSALGLLIMTVFAFAAQIERERISERTKEAFARKKANGEKLGRPFGCKNKTNKIEKLGIADRIQELRAQGFSHGRIARIINYELKGREKTSAASVGSYLKTISARTIGRHTDA